MPRSALSRSSLLDQYLSGRQRIFSLIAEVDPDLADQAFLGEWSMIDLLAHLIGWDNTNCAAFQQILDGQYPHFFQFYDRDWCTYNARLVVQYRREEWEEMIEVLSGSTEMLGEFYRGLPDWAFTTEGVVREGSRTISISRLLKYEIQDEKVHIQQIETFLQSCLSASDA